MPENITTPNSAPCPAHNSCTKAHTPDYPTIASRRSMIQKLASGLLFAPLLCAGCRNNRETVAAPEERENNELPEWVEVHPETRSRVIVKDFRMRKRYSSEKGVLPAHETERNARNEKVWNEMSVFHLTGINLYINLNHFKGDTETVTVFLEQDEDAPEETPPPSEEFLIFLATTFYPAKTKSEDWNVQEQNSFGNNGTKALMAMKDG